MMREAACPGGPAGNRARSVQPHRNDRRTLLNTLAGRRDLSVPEQLNRDDLGGLDPAVVAALRAALQLPEVRALAAVTELDVLVVVLGLLAGVMATQHRGAAGCSALLGVADPVSVDVASRAVSL